jgi:hypothetical protein
MKSHNQKKAKGRKDNKMPYINPTDAQRKAMRERVASLRQHEEQHPRTQASATLPDWRAAMDEYNAAVKNFRETVRTYSAGEQKDKYEALRLRRESIKPLIAKSLFKNSICLAFRTIFMQKN